MHVQLHVSFMPMQHIPKQVYIIIPTGIYACVDQISEHTDHCHSYCSQFTVIDTAHSSLLITLLLQTQFTVMLLPQIFHCYNGYCYCTQLIVMLLHTARCNYYCTHFIVIVHTIHYHCYCTRFIVILLLHIVCCNYYCPHFMSLILHIVPCIQFIVIVTAHSSLSFLLHIAHCHCLCKQIIVIVTFADNCRCYCTQIIVIVTAQRSLSLLPYWVHCHCYCIQFTVILIAHSSLSLFMHTDNCCYHTQIIVIVTAHRPSSLLPY